MADTTNVTTLLDPLDNTITTVTILMATIRALGRAIEGTDDKRKETENKTDELIHFQEGLQKELAQMTLDHNEIQKDLVYKITKLEVIVETQKKKNQSFTRRV